MVLTWTGCLRHDANDDDVDDEVIKVLCDVMPCVWIVKFRLRSLLTTGRYRARAS